MDILQEITQAATALRRLDERRKRQQTYRDELIRRATDSGAGWASIRRAAGLTDRGLALALKRTTPD